MWQTHEEKVSSGLDNLPHVDLDPDDWHEFRELSHSALDNIVDHLQTIRTRPVWTVQPEHVRAQLDEALPEHGRPFEEVLRTFRDSLQPYATGNVHPGFMGWVHGAGTPVGMVAEMLASGLNANCGGRNHAGINLENQITQWMRDVFEFPQGASGVFVSGSSMANFVGLLVARHQAVGDEVRTMGIAARPPLCAYSSAAAHGCIAQAMELSGIGSSFLRRIPCGPDGRMELTSLRAAIASDRRQGFRPFLVIGTAGTVDIGAIDPLDDIADIAAAEDIWFHVDGAFGALAALSTELRPLIAGIERADSIAFDFHKWVHVPYEAGFLLVRDGEVHRRTFAAPQGYLTRAPVGLAAGVTWPCDLGPELSRSFRALKVWFTLQVFGQKALGPLHSANLPVGARSGVEDSSLDQIRSVRPRDTQYRVLHLEYHQPRRRQSPAR